MPWIKTGTFKIFNNTDKQNEKYPDWNGSCELDGPVIEAIFKQYKKAKSEGNEAKATLKIAFWDAVESSKGNGVKYLNANMSILKEEEKQGEDIEF